MMPITNDKLLSKADGKLWREVQKQLSVIRNLEESEMMGGSQFAILPWDVIYKIFLLLPAESLHLASLVCRGWFQLIRSSYFIESHSQESDNVLIFLQTIKERRPKRFSLVPLSLFSWKEDRSQVTYINFLDIVQDGNSKLGKVTDTTVCGLKKILATCNGLMLGEFEHKRGLLVMNPASRKRISFPLGTILNYGESYGLVFSHATRDYKVVHLFNDKIGHTNCEIFSLSKRSWRAVDGPSPSFRKFNNKYKPVEVLRSLHWLPRSSATHCRSMDVEDEKFFTIKLPRIGKEEGIKLVELKGCLAFISRCKESRTVNVWTLSGLKCGEVWEKKHSITTSNTVLLSMVPICTLGFGREIMFYSRKMSSLYTYDLETEDMRAVKLDCDTCELDSLNGFNVLPHRNTLVSWDSRDVLN